MREELRVNLAKAGVNYVSLIWRRLSRTLQKSTGRQSAQVWLSEST